jgi:putative addiction module component (TIGR02574 family)
MPVNIDEIKTLPNEEKLKIIDELWESIEDDWEKEEQGESSEIMHLLEEREEVYKKGGMKSYKWEEVEEKIKKNLAQQKNEKK